MNRQEILDNYKVNKYGTISSPGKFEGEPLYVPFFWDLALTSCGETLWLDDTEYTLFTIDEEDRRMFPELEARQLLLHESEQGFVYCEHDPDLRAFENND